MKKLLDIGFPQLSWVVGSISDNVIKKVLKSAKKRIHILKAYIVVHITKSFVPLAILGQN